jgi:hypothetical protein
MKIISASVPHPSGGRPCSLVMEGERYLLLDGETALPVSEPWARSEHMRQLVRGSGLKKAEIAERLRVPLSTVRNWVLSETSPSHRNPPAAMIRLAELMLR